MGDGLVHCNYVCAFKTILECIDLDQLPPRNLVNSVGAILFFRRIVLTHRFFQLSNQRQLIVNEFGFTLRQTTLLGCVDGAVESMCFPLVDGLN